MATAETALAPQGHQVHGFTAAHPIVGYPKRDGVEQPVLGTGRAEGKLSSQRGFRRAVG